MRTEIGHDRDGKPIHEGDIVFHNNRRRPPGDFRVEWDNGKLGYVLGGLGETGLYWLREWCCEHVKVIKVGRAGKRAMEAKA